MSRTRTLNIAAAITILVLAGVAYEAVSTQPVRGAMRTCSELFTIANRPGLSDQDRLDAARALCSARYLQSRPLTLAAEGGIVGIPRNINMHFTAWHEGPNVWICTRDRRGPVYQFVHENGRWLFDGLVALIKPGGEIVRTTELPELPSQ